jgi:hypothetical protein
MSLFVVEGARKSGKTYLVNSQKTLPTFKFDFNGAFEGLGLPRNSENTHYFGLGKEIMLHQLDNQGFIENTIIDRGIITNSVWGIFQKRVTISEVESELNWIIREGLLGASAFIHVKGTFDGERTKDLWDSDESRLQEEKDLFDHFFKYVSDRGVRTFTFYNRFDDLSLDLFNRLIIEIK